MPEPRLVGWNRLGEGGEPCCQNFDALEIGASSFERATKFAFHPINCRICTH